MAKGKDEKDAFPLHETDDDGRQVKLAHTMCNCYAKLMDSEMNFRCFCLELITAVGIV